MVLIMTSMTGCGVDNSENTVKSTEKKVIASSLPVTLRLTVAPRIAKGLKGDFTRNVSFSIQERPWHKFINGKLDCKLQMDAHLKCETTDSLSQLSEGKTYRIIIFSQKTNFLDQANDEIACDYFIYDKSQVPSMAITPKSSGECLLWQLQNDTGYSEEEIRTRVRHILNDEEIPDDYDLPLTLYEMYKSYDNEYDWVEALREMTRAIKANDQLSPARKSQIEGSGRFFD